MEPLQFAYWLQGFSELNGGPPTPEQWQSIKEHLATVFHKVTPHPIDARPQPYRPGWDNGVITAPFTPPLRAECVC